MEPKDYVDRRSPGLLRPLGASRIVDMEPMEGGGSVLTWEQAVRVVRKHLGVLLGVFLVVVSTSVAIAFLMRDVYRPTARLEIDPLEGSINTLHEIENVKSAADADYLDTQVQILQSDGLAMRVIRALRLDQNPEYAKQNAGNKATAQADSRSSASSVGAGSFLREQLALAEATPSEAEALQNFHRKVSVSPVRGSRLVEVSVTSHDPKLAQSVTNTLVTQFMDRSYRSRYETTMEASEWLSSQLDDLRRRVASSNQAVADYQKRYGLVEADEKDVPLGQLMGDVSKQLSDAQADRIQAEAAVRLIDAGQTESIPAFRGDTVYQNLLTHYADARGQLAEAQAVYGDESANVRKLKGQIEELSAQVEAERDRLVKRARTAFYEAKSREEMMAQEREKLHVKMGDASSHLVEYGMLKNEAVANAALYNTLQTRLREAGIYAGLHSGNIHVVDMARNLEKPTGPMRGVIIGVGMALSLLLAVSIAFVRESFDNTVRIPDDIKNWTHLPFLAVVPTVRANSQAKGALPATIGGAPQLAENAQSSYPRLFWSRMQTAEGEAVRGLRTALLTSADRPPQVVLVSSPSVGEGKTTIALNLASVLAQTGTTCLIEGDMRRPMIHSALHMSPRFGLGDVLAGKKSVSDVLLPAQSVPGLTILPTGNLSTTPSDLLSCDVMRTTLDTLRTQFEHVVIDSPPLLAFSDGRTLAALSDAVILVSRYGYTTRRAMLRSAELLSEVKAPLLGVVLNDIDLASPDYHYFNYGYSRAVNGRKYQDVYKPFVPLDGSEKKEPEKSRGAHA